MTKLSPGLICVVMLVACFIEPAAGQSNRIELKYRPAPADNPLKGLVPYQNPQPDRFPHSMEFNYLPLSRLVVGRDEYDWQPLEDILNNIKSRGNQTVFRVFLEYPGKKNCIPQYLIDDGLKVHKYTNTNTAPLPPANVETPDYEDDNLRACLKNYVAALGQKYDGDPRIAYITAGLLGTWGEWHNYPRNDLWASKGTQGIVLDAYEAAFSKTPVLLRYPAGEGHFAQAATHRRPFGYHDDSFAHATLDTGRKEDSWYFEPALIAAGAGDCWKIQPIGGEIRPEVWGCCFDDSPCTKPSQSFAACRDKLHVTWLMDSGMFREKAPPDRHRRAVEAVQKMGYEFHVTAAKVTGRNLEITFRNTGIAPFYHSGWTVDVAILNGTASVGEIQHTDWELTGVLPGHSVVKTHRLSAAPGEDTILGLRMPNPMKGGKVVRFANANQDAHVDGWLSLIEGE